MDLYCKYAKCSWWRSLLTSAVNELGMKQLTHFTGWRSCANLHKYKLMHLLLCNFCQVVLRAFCIKRQCNQITFGNPFLNLEGEDRKKRGVEKKCCNDHSSWMHTLTWRGGLSVSEKVRAMPIRRLDSIMSLDF